MPTKENCKKWLIFPDHLWGKWSKTHETFRKSIMGERMLVGFIQQRTCRRCGKTQSEETSYD